MDVHHYSTPISSSHEVEGATAGMNDKLASLHREMANLRMECHRLMHKHEIVKQSLASTGHIDTSSAYNTGGESCCSGSPEGLNCVECQSCLVICPPSPSPSTKSSSYKTMVDSNQRASSKQDKTFYQQQGSQLFDTQFIYGSPGMIYAPGGIKKEGKIGNGWKDNRQENIMHSSLRVRTPSPVRKQIPLSGPSCPSPLMRRSVLLPNESPKPSRRQDEQIYKSSMKPPSSPSPLHRSRVLPPSHPIQPSPPSYDFHIPSSFGRRPILPQVHIDHATFDTPRPSPAPADPVEARRSIRKAQEEEGKKRRESPVKSMEESYRSNNSYIITNTQSTVKKAKNGGVVKKFMSRGSNGVRETLYMFERPIDDFIQLYGQTSEDEEGIRDDSIIGIPSLNKTSDVQYKWKVKRRCDGSRYIVKRPVRSQVLKKREAQLLRERPGISTDDDALSAIKLGQFVSREERKRILERERMKKRRQQQKILDAESAMAEQSTQPILSLSHKKLLKKQEELLMDDFATTEEWLSQRNRVDGKTRHKESNGRQKRGIATVTTV